MQTVLNPIEPKENRLQKILKKDTYFIDSQRNSYDEMNISELNKLGYDIPNFYETRGIDL